MMGRILIWLIRLYQRYISPLKPPTCRYTPTCSHYAAQVIKNRGALEGSVLATMRVLRCNPLFPGGYDPPPKPRPKGDIMKKVFRILEFVLAITILSWAMAAYAEPGTPTKNATATPKAPSMAQDAPGRDATSSENKDTGQERKPADQGSKSQTQDAHPTVDKPSNGTGTAKNPILHDTAMPLNLPDDDPKSLTYEGPLWKAVLTRYGATFRSFVLKDKRFKEYTVPKDELASGRLVKKLMPIDMIKTWSPAWLPYIISAKIVEDADTISQRKHYAIARIRRQKWTLLESKVTEDKAVYRFKLETVPGFPVEAYRTIVLYPNRYSGDMVLELKNVSRRKIWAEVALQIASLHEGEKGRSMFSPVSFQKQAICYHGGDVSIQPLPVILGEEKPSSGCGGCSGGCGGCARTPSKKSVFAQGAVWGGIDYKYFLIAAVRDYPVPDGGCVFWGFKLKEIPGYGVIATYLDFAKREIEPGKSEVYPLKFYMGPKDVKELGTVRIQGDTPNTTADPHLTDAVDFGGILAPISKFMLWALKITYPIFGNWGLAIIFLTILIKLSTIYWTTNSMRSMKKMANLKPHMDKLQEQYGHDKEKLNQELMNLYKKHNVSPLSGCLPMLLQLPIYIAWYQALASSTELYRAPLFGWIGDLTARDPYYVLPILMGLFMFLQQKMSPNTADNEQAKMMLYMMPIMFTGIMLFLPSGLTLYILTNSVLSMAHQWYLNHSDA